MIETKYRSTWPEEMGIDVIDSIQAYEVYGDIRVVNETFGFFHNTTREICEDYACEVPKFIDLIERNYVLQIAGKSDEYCDIMFSMVRKKQGSSLNECEHWRSAIKIFDGIPIGNDFIRQQFDALANSWLPVFQRRTDWSIIYGDFCHRCHQDTGHINGDYQLRVRGRIGFGFVPEDKVLSRKRILSRKFENVL